MTLTPDQLLRLDVETLAALTDPRSDAESVLKLEYLSEQLLDPSRRDDRTYLLDVKRDVMRQIRR